MNLLLVLTLIFVAILVLALAASLIAILVYLTAISRHLGEVERLLGSVEESTRPLHGPVELLQGVANGTGQSLSEAAGSLTQANEHLAAYSGTLR